MIDQIYLIIGRLIMADDLDEWQIVEMHAMTLISMGLTDSEIERYIQNYRGENDA